jgi:hypothetical protein
VGDPQQRRSGDCSTRILFTQSEETLRPYRLITVGIRVFAQKLSPLGLINEQRHQVFPVCLFHYIQVDFNTSPQRSEELLFRHRLK